ncbi:MAG: hypothetical protein WC725_03535 [Patescibacteria group bacterium]|jgi:hypothetical protein
MDTNQQIKSKMLKWVIFGIAELALVAIVFRTGMMVGFAKANFNFSWGEQYHNMFGGPRGGWIGGRGGMMGGAFDRDDFSPGHNVVGSVIKVSSSTIIVKGADNTEKLLSISEGTTIRKGGTNIKISELKENDRIVAIGSPSTTGQIEASFIRVFQP